MILKKAQMKVANMHVVIYKEGKQFVAHSPSIALATCGDSREDAVRMFDEAASIFFEELARMGTLDKELTRLGWVKTSKEGWEPPLVVASELRPAKIRYA
jgi:predicted RNase H-like HicB family nuclease